MNYSPQFGDNNLKIRSTREQVIIIWEANDPYLRLSERDAATKLFELQACKGTFRKPATSAHTCPRSTARDQKCFIFQEGGKAEGSEIKKLLWHRRRTNAQLLLDMAVAVIEPGPQW